MKTSLLVMSLLFSVIGYTESSNANQLTIPGCVGMIAEAEEGQLRIKPKDNVKQRLILLQNIAETKLWVSLSVGLNIELDQSHAAALTELNQELIVSCVQIKPGSETYIDCATAVKLCAFDKVDFGKTKASTYWIAENANLDKILIMINANGIRIND